MGDHLQARGDARGSLTILQQWRHNIRADTVEFSLRKIAVLNALLSGVERNLPVSQIVWLQVEEHYEAVVRSRLGLNIPPIHRVDRILQRFYCGG
jgi:hypothetical protein